MVYIVMGVSGSGKSTIGRMLADRLSLPFYDGDDFHPESNLKKMKAGVALDDSDRGPWLTALAGHIMQWNREAAGGAVLACSALKQMYRELLSPHGGVTFVYLRGSRELIAKRLADRPGHFFPPKLLATQLATLEEPADAVVVDIDAPAQQIVDTAARLIAERTHG